LLKTTLALITLASSTGTSPGAPTGETIISENGLLDGTLLQRVVTVSQIGPTL
jgi:hypothetical protein